LLVRHLGHTRNHTMIPIHLKIESIKRPGELHPGLN
jgi:hypothetical protein